jgi:hypothetical protein
MDRGGAGNPRDECAGHGSCLYEDPAHNAGKPPGPKIPKKCQCNKNGGWYEDMNSGGSCVLGCPGAVATGKEEKCDIESGSCRGAGLQERKQVCSNAGKSWEDDSKSGRKHTRGCYTRVEAKSNMYRQDGPTSLCLKCDSGSTWSRKVAEIHGNAAVLRQRNAGSCMAVDRLAGASQWGAAMNPQINNANWGRSGNIFSEQFNCGCEYGGDQQQTHKAIKLVNWDYYHKQDSCFPESSYEPSKAERYISSWWDYLNGLSWSGGRCGHSTLYPWFEKRCWP